MKIHQLTVHYDPSEDRLLLRIGTTDQAEIQVWLTRRLTLMLAPNLPKVLEAQLTLMAEGSPETPHLHDPQSPSRSKPPQWLNQSDLSGEYRPPLTRLNDGDPLLVTDMDLKPDKDGLTLLVLKERRAQSKTERKLELRLEPPLLQGLYHLISESLPRTDWAQGGDLTRSIQAGSIDPTPPKHLLN